jgi:hypothetical protein
LEAALCVDFPEAQDRERHEEEDEVLVDGAGGKCGGFSCRLINEDESFLSNTPSLRPVTSSVRTLAYARCDLPPFKPESTLPLIPFPHLLQNQ